MTADHATANPAQAVARLRAEARDHKRKSAFHRRRAKELMIEAAGIEVIHTAQTQEVTAHVPTAHP